MRTILIQDDLKLVEDRLKQFESRTGAELLLVIADAADPYPAASWRFGVVSAFFIALSFSLFLDFNFSWLWPVFIFILTLLMTWVGHFPWAKRLALSDWEVARETREKAIECFHTLGSSKVSHKVTAMIMISALEKNIQVLVDEKLKTQITQDELDELVALMSNHFKDGNIGVGLINSIQRLEDKILKDFGGRVTQISNSELSDHVHFLHLS